MRLTVSCLLYWCASVGLLGQTCAPSPGPAIFLESFGSGANPGDALPGGTSTHTYGSIDEGGYVVTNTTDLMPNFWHAGVDHTEGDTDGYMLLFNAASGASVFYRKTFEELCPNTDYVFSAYIANIAIPTACIGVAFQPDIRFTIIDPSDESILLTTTTDEIFYSSTLVWREYGLQFRTSPEQSTLRIELSNNTVSGCGNDLAIDDLSLRLCNPQIEQSFELCDLPSGSLSVGSNTYTEPGTYLDALPIPDSCNDTLVTTILSGSTRVLPPLNFNFCAGDTLEVAGRIFTTSSSFVDTLPGPLPDCPLFQAYEIEVQDQLTTTQEVTLCSGESLQVGTQTYTEAGTYSNTLLAAAGCDSVVITTIKTGEIQVAIEPVFVEVELGQSTPLLANVSLADSFSLAWQPAGAFSCADCPSTVFQPTESGLYRLVATDLRSGCTASTALQANVLRCDQVYVPNVFSPNDDGVNDRLLIGAEDCFTRLLSFRLFDRWGGQVYAAKAVPLAGNFLGWDGRKDGQNMAQGVYTYDLVVERENGTLMQVTGEIVLLR